MQPSDPPAFPSPRMQTGLVKGPFPVLRHPAGAIAEADHRIANSLQLLSALISREIRLLGQEEAAGRGDAGRAALFRARAGILAIAELHRMLQQAAAVQQAGVEEAGGQEAGLQGAGPGLDAAAYLERICGAFAKILPAHRRIRLTAESVHMPGPSAGLVGILVSELIMNAAKHAYGPAEPGDIRVVLKADHGHPSRLVVEDRGLSQPRAHPGTGLGQSLISMVARQLGGQPVWEDAAPGLRFVLQLSIPGR